MAQLTKLRRVIAVNQTVDTEDGWATLASVELWEDGVQLRVSSERMPDPFRGDLDFPRERINVQFFPEVPGDASRLLIFAPVMRVEQPIEVLL